MKELNEQDFSPEESLKLIHSMIETTRNLISDKSPYFLIWGWAVMIGCFLQYYLKVIVGSSSHPLAWLVTPVALVIFLIVLIRDKKREKVKTFISEAYKYLWTSIGFSFIVLSFIFSNIRWQFCYPVYILLYGIGTFVSGCLIKFKLLIFGGLTCFLYLSFLLILILIRR